MSIASTDTDAFLPTSAFSFSPLSNERHEIRILALLPGSWADDIYCHLSVVSLDDHPHYHALSYAWGHHSVHSSIFVDDHDVPITPSLESALRQIRQENNVLSLWVDKLCIDQNNEKEKSNQVAMMHRVYRQCSNALIWLGAQRSSERPIKHRSCRIALPQALALFCCCFGKRHQHEYTSLPQYEDEDAIDPFTMIRHFAFNKHISDLPCFQRKRKSGKLVFKGTARFRTMWLLFRELLETPWHMRFWCVQEALLPKCAWVLYGSWKIPFQTVMIALRNYERHLFTCCSDTEKLFTGSAYSFSPDSLYLTPTPGPNLDTLLRTYRYKHCKDPRDKVYGILAILQDPAMLDVDYALQVGDVYSRAMQVIVEKSQGDLRCFTGVGFGANPYGMPSWIRDLSRSISITAVQMEMRRLEAYDLYNSDRNLEGQAVSQLGTTLCVSGAMVDTIEHISLPMDVPIEQLDYKYGAQILFYWYRTARLSGHKISVLRPRVLEQAFWRTILSDLVWVPRQGGFRRFTSSDVEDYERWLRQTLWSWITSPESALKDVYVRSLLCSTYGRCLFVTAKGNLGLCYPDARPGDQIWILKGAKVPMILRARSVTEEETSTYSLLGDCYLHEHMDGQSATGTGAQSTVLTVA